MILQWKEVLVIFLAFLGLSIATYLLLEHYSLAKEVGYCPMFENGCSTVLNSEYSVIFFNIPNALLGIFYYLTLLGFGFYLWFKKDTITKNTMLLISAFGAIFSIYLLYVQYALIGAYCFYCVSSAFITFIIFALEIIILLQNKKDEFKTIKND